MLPGCPGSGRLKYVLMLSPARSLPAATFSSLLFEIVIVMTPVAGSKVPLSASPTFVGVFAFGAGFMGSRAGPKSPYSKVTAPDKSDLIAT